MNYNFNGTITQNGQPISGGGSLYLHDIRINEGSLEINLTIYTSFDTPFTLESLGSYFNENGIIYSSRGIGVIGKYKSGSNNYLSGLLFYYDNSNLRVYMFQIYASAPSANNIDITTSATLSDLVIEL